MPLTQKSKARESALVDEHPTRQLNREVASLAAQRSARRLALVSYPLARKRAYAAALGAWIHQQPRQMLFIRLSSASSVSADAFSAAVLSSACVV